MRAGATSDTVAPALPDLGIEDRSDRDLRAPVHRDDAPSAAAAAADVAMDSLRRLVQALRSQGLHTERELGVTTAQLYVLRQIAAHPGQSVAELARRTATRESSVSEVVSRLVAGGFVQRRRAATDRRRVELLLAPSGERVIAVAPETVQERLMEGLRRLPDEERRAVSRGLRAWLAAAGLQDAPAVMFFESPEPGGGTGAP